MQVDFHYYCVFVLAYLAGYEKEDAKIMAYASQYVDDANEEKPILVANAEFVPVRTAHNGIRAKNSFNSKNIVIPFHFIPPYPHQNGEPFSYLTQADSVLANFLLQNAFSIDDDLSRYRIGIAVHTFADTWSHQDFSGRESEENNLDRLWKSENGETKKCSFFWKLWNFIIDRMYGMVGHSQALRYPDISHYEWMYEKKKDNVYKEFSNADRFMVAAEKIFFQFAEQKALQNAQDIWRENKDKIYNLFHRCHFCGKKALKEKCENWVKAFPDIFSDNSLIYNKEEWKKQAEEKKNVTLHELRETDWAKFHQAAREQREFVLAHLE